MSGTANSNGGGLDAQYLKETVGDTLAEAMAQLATVQPVDPIAFLGEYLLHAGVVLRKKKERKEALEEIERQKKEEIIQLERERLARIRALRKINIDRAKEYVKNLVARYAALAKQNPDDSQRHTRLYSRAVARDLLQGRHEDKVPSFDQDGEIWDDVEVAKMESENLSAWSDDLLEYEDVPEAGGVVQAMLLLCGYHVEEIGSWEDMMEIVRAEYFVRRLESFVPAAHDFERLQLRLARALYVLDGIELEEVYALPLPFTVIYEYIKAAIFQYAAVLPPGHSLDMGITDRPQGSKKAAASITPRHPNKRATMESKSDWDEALLELFPELDTDHVVDEDTPTSALIVDVTWQFVPDPSEVRPSPAVTMTPGYEMEMDTRAPSRLVQDSSDEDDSDLDTSTLPPTTPAKGSGAGGADDDGESRRPTVDLGCIMLSRTGDVIGSVYFNQVQSKDSSVRLEYGEAMRGGNARFVVDTPNLPDHVHTLAFVASTNVPDQSFKNVESVHVEIREDNNRATDSLAYFVVNGRKKSSLLLLNFLYRDPDAAEVFKVTAIGEFRPMVSPVYGQNFMQALPRIHDLLGLLSVGQILEDCEESNPYDLTRGDRFPILYNRVMIGLGWEVSKAVDLDACIVTFTSDGEKDAIIDFDNLSSEDGAIVHQGDNQEGIASGDNEKVSIALHKVDKSVDVIVVVVTIYEESAFFKDVPYCYARLYDRDTEKELCRFNVEPKTEALAKSSAQILCKLARRGQGWSLVAIGEPSHARIADDLITQIEPFLAPGWGRGETMKIGQPMTIDADTIRVGLGWTCSGATDLDASCICFGADGNQVQVVDFGNLKTKDGSIVHSGDNMDGETDGENESVTCRLIKISSKIHTLVFLVSIYDEDRFFTDVESAFFVLTDVQLDSQIARFDVVPNQLKQCTGQALLKLSRGATGNSWFVTPIARPVFGRTVPELKESLPIFATPTWKAPLLMDPEDRIPLGTKPGSVRVGINGVADVGDVEVICYYQGKRLQVSTAIQVEKNAVANPESQESQLGDQWSATIDFGLADNLHVDCIVFAATPSSENNESGRPVFARISRDTGADIAVMNVIGARKGDVVYPCKLVNAGRRGWTVVGLLEAHPASSPATKDDSHWTRTEAKKNKGKAPVREQSQTKIKAVTGGKTPSKNLRASRRRK